MPPSSPSAPAVCPPWCVADHEAQHHPEDRWHYGAQRDIPAVELWGRFERGRWLAAEVVLDLAVSLEQSVDTGALYVLLGAAEERERTFRLTPESARRLLRALVDLLKTDVP